jgi:MFS superfamily sulfate permease-like transporter
MQGFAVSGADSRTAVNDSVGGKSQVTSLVTAGLLVLILLFLTAPLGLLPITVLAAVLINAALGLFDIKSLALLRRVSHQEFRLSIVASLGVITLGVLPGVAIAVGLAILQLLVKASNPHDAVLGQMPGADGFHDIKGRPQAMTFPRFVIYRFDSSLVFFNADFFKSRVRAVVKDAEPRPQYFLLDAETMPFLDTTGAASLEEVVDELSGQGIAFAVAEAKGPVRVMLEKTGLKQKIGERNFFPALETAVAALSEIDRVEAK